MNPTRILFYTGLALMLVVGAMAVSQSHAAQTPVGTITAPSTGQTTLKAYNDSYVNPKLTIIGGNFDDIATNKADKSCFATESAFNACFDLTWAAGGSLSWPASDGAYYAAKDGAWASLATVYQPLDSDLTTFSGLACTEGQIPKKNSSSVWVCGSDVEGAGGGISHATSDGNYYASRNGAWANIATAFATVANALVGDCTVGPCLDGTSDGGTLIKLYGPGGYWQALQAGNSVANRSWRLMIGAPPAAGTTTLLNVDEYGQMGQVATSTYLTPSGVGGALTVTATGFDGNLATTDNTLQEIAQKFDDYTGGGSMTWPAAAGIMVYGGSSAYGTSLVADGDAIGEVVVVQDDGSGNPELPFTIDLSVLTDTTGILTGKLSISSIDDAPVDSETSAPISSNYMYDHVNGADPHTGYVLESSVISGTVELNTTTVANSGVIASGSSQLLATHATATGAATTDSCEWGFVGDPVANTGFVPSANGMLSVWCYVDATGYVQVRTSNNTASSITLNTAGNGATIKWMVRK